jgi:hypothetical protein
LGSLGEFSEDELVAHNASFEEARLKKHFGIEFGFVAAVWGRARGVSDDR